MEKINEQYGEGNCYDYGERMYDPRIGRWMKMDGLAGKAPSWSPYRFGLDNPIRYSDSEGEFEIDESTAKAYPHLDAYLQNLSATYTGVSHKLSKMPLKNIASYLMVKLLIC